MFFLKKKIIAGGPLGPPVIFFYNILHTININVHFQIKLKNFLGPKILSPQSCPSPVEQANPSSTAYSTTPSATPKKLKIYIYTQATGYSASIPPQWIWSLGYPLFPSFQAARRHLVPSRPGEWGSGLFTGVIAPQRDPRLQIQLIQSIRGSSNKFFEACRIDYHRLGHTTSNTSKKFQRNEIVRAKNIFKISHIQ